MVLYNGMFFLKRGLSIVKRSKVISYLAGAFGLAAIVVLGATLFYPYSALSLHKSYAYKPYKVTNDEGKTYKQELDEFRKSYEKDLEALMEKDGADRTVTYTQFLMENFEESWLVSKKRVPINMETFEAMVFKLDATKEALLLLLTEEKYTTDERQQLVQLVQYIDSMKDDIDLTRYGNLTRKETKTMLGNLYVEYMGLFMHYTNFYEGVMERTG